MADRLNPGFRSRAAVIAVVAWWAALVLAVAGWLLLDASLAGAPGRVGQVGIWVVGFAALASVVGWGATVGSILRDRGRVRAGAFCLLALPLVAGVLGWAATSSTLMGPNDPLPVLWVVVSVLLLGVGTLLIALPEHLGTH